MLARIQPVGTVVLAEPSGPKGMLTGEQVYGQVCKTCHETGLAGAPKFGDKAAWAKVIAQGDKLAFEHAIDGFNAMPPKGGNSDLTDDEVKRAVVFMANKAGANWTAARSRGRGARGRRGRAHGPAGRRRRLREVPRNGRRRRAQIGDRAAWIQRAKLGLNTVYQSALKGHAGMPARGGMADLSDTEVKRAVEYMLNAARASRPRSQRRPPRLRRPRPPRRSRAADGKKIYESGCIACHGAGIAGAPKFGDKAAWAPRIKHGDGRAVRGGAPWQGRHAAQGRQHRRCRMPTSRPRSISWWPRRSNVPNAGFARPTIWSDESARKAWAARAFRVKHEARRSSRSRPFSSVRMRLKPNERSARSNARYRTAAQRL